MDWADCSYVLKNTHMVIVCVYVCIWRLVVDVFFYCSPLYCWSRVSHWTWSSRILLGWLSKKIPEFPVSDLKYQSHSPWLVSKPWGIRTWITDTTGTSLPELFSCLQASNTRWLSTTFTTVPETWLRHLSRTWNVSKPVPHTTCT